MPRRATGRPVNRAELADLLGVSLPTVDAYVRGGCPYEQRGAKGREWLFNSRAVIEWLRQRDVEQALGTAQSTTFDEARRRKTAAEATLAEMELASKRREMIHVDDVAAVVASEYSACRSRLMSIPARLATACAGVADAAAVEKLIRDEIVDALTELTDDGSDGDQEPA